MHNQWERSAMQFQGSEGTGTDVSGLVRHPGRGGRQGPPLSNQRLARRIRAFYRLMRYRRELVGMRVPASGEDTGRGA